MLDLANYEVQAREAVKAFWGNREAARQKQLAAGKIDQGSRSMVTAGKNMDGFLVLLQEIIRRNGLPHADIHLQRGVLTLPGYFRPTKQWDILVMNQGILVAAIELKSQVGSFSNNFNNRTEETIGTAVDLWTAYREGAFGRDAPRPFLGWLMLIGDCDESRTPVRDATTQFPMSREFYNTSYADRYNIYCQKLVQEGLYSSACFMLSPSSAEANGSYTEMSPLTSLNTFVSTLAGHIAAEAARSSQGFPRLM